jgi:hypothetical protein
MFGGGVGAVGGKQCARLAAGGVGKVGWIIIGSEGRVLAVKKGDCWASIVPVGGLSLLRL